MMNPLAAIYERIMADATITGQLGTWHDDPAIVSVSPIPEDVEGPFIALREGASSITQYQGIMGLSQEITIGCFSDNEESLYAMQELAGAIFTLLNQANYEEGNTWGVVWSTCSWPVPATSDNGFQGYQLTCTVQAYQEEGI